MKKLALMFICTVLTTHGRPSRYQFPANAEKITTEARGNFRFSYTVDPTLTNAPIKDLIDEIASVSSVRNEMLKVSGGLARIGHHREGPDLPIKTIRSKSDLPTAAQLADANDPWFSTDTTFTYWILPSRWKQPDSNPIAVGIAYEVDNWIHCHVIVPPGHTGADQQPLKDLLLSIDNRLTPNDLQCLKKMIQKPSSKTFPVLVATTIIIVGIVLGAPKEMARWAANWTWDGLNLPQQQRVAL